MNECCRRLADALLGPATIDEWMAVTKSTSFASSQAHWDWDRVQAFLAARRARLLAPAKSVEERVEDILKRTHGDFGYKAVAAEIIATLKQEGAK